MLNCNKLVDSPICAVHNLAHRNNCLTRGDVLSGRGSNMGTMDNVSLELEELKNESKRLGTGLLVFCHRIDRLTGHLGVRQTLSNVSDRPSLRLIKFSPSGDDLLK